MAGLVAGLGAGRVLGFDSGAVPDAPARVAAMVDELASVGLSRPSPMISRCAWTTARLDLAMRQSPTRRAARSTMPGVPKGSSLNLCKTAKALAGLTAAVERDEILPGERTVFAAAVDINQAIEHGAFRVGEQAGLPLHRFNLEDAPAAHAAVESGAVGKVLITVASG
jgi:hypothetical protein